MFSHLERAAPKPSIATDDEAQPPDSVRRRQLTVQILLPPASGKTPQPASWLLTYLFPNDSLIVGRTPQRADVAIPGDPELSGAHMQFSLSESSCRVTDLGSSNGSWLNGLRFSDELLQHGDGIHAGRTYVLVHLDSGKAATLRKPLATVDVADSRRKRQQQKLRTRGFQIINKTPFRFAPLTGRMGYPRHSLTLIVKGTFEFCPGKPMTFAEEQLFPMPEEPYLDTEDPAAPPRYENDFAFDKPKADILLAGHCHAPRGKPVDKLTAEVRVGEWSRSLDVCGRRSWQFVRGHWKQSSPEPFTSLELRYEHSYGGPGFDENPFGVGYIDKKELRSGGPVPIPQIVAPGDVPKSPDESSVAVGFGPLAKYAGRRRKQLGTYDELWEQRYWPWFPPDFSWDHFNAAPEEQQLHEPLRGDEKIELKNLNAKNPLYKTALPGIR